LGTLTGRDAASTWSLDTAQTYNDGVLGGQDLTFTGFATLQGGTNADTFQVKQSKPYNLKGGLGADTFAFTDAKVLTGTIDGEADADTLDFSAYSTAVNVTLTTASTANGYNGTDGGVSSGFSGIDTLKGSAAVDTLTGRNASNSW